ncbi:MAG: LacI family transcriptional regulator [Bifidobacteriaceae bacterium]|nr:LacI family transcriptional regulator [Bifidobacteriaceae bacterium]
MTPPTRTTLREVAAAAGVSVCTASKAVRYESGVAPATAARVRAQAKALGYIPDSSARSLVSRSTHSIGMLFSNTLSRYYGSILPAVNSAAHDRGYTVVFGDSVDAAGVPQADLERAFVTSLMSHRVAGVILMAPITADSLSIFQRWTVPTVFLDSAPPSGFQDIPSVAADNFEGGRLAGQHLVEHGYRSFVFLGHSSVWPTRKDREDGFVSAVSPYGKADVLEGGYSAAQAERAALSYFSTNPDPPDAIFTSNDTMLLGAISAMQHVGLRLGDDIAGISFDEFDWASRIGPPVTTVNQHIDRLGKMAAEMILDLCGARPHSQQPTQGRRQIAPELIVRQSCGCSAGSADLARPRRLTT